MWAPIVLLESYLAFTVLIFFFGPVDWDVPNATKLLLFLLVNFGGLWFGFSRGINQARVRRRRSFAGNARAVLLSPRLIWLLVFSMVVTIVTDLLRLYAIRGGVGAFASSFTNPGEAYRSAQILAQMDRDGQVMDIANFSWAFRISTLLGPFNGLYLPLALVGWRRLGSALKVLFLITVLSAVVFTVGLGAQNGIGVLLFSSVPVLLYKLYITDKSPAAIRLTGPTTTTKQLNPMLAKLLVMAALGAFVATVIFFQLDRAEDSGRELNAARDLGGEYASPSTAGLVKVTGERLNYGFVMACNYVSHGYEGLALSMELPFEWTYGLGWSKALQVILHDYLGGPDVSVSSYINRTSQESGWPLSWWSTIFPWIASDTTYYGTVFVMVFIGFAMGRSWADVASTGNPFGLVFLAQMFTLVFMFPANNALAQTLEGLVSLIGVCLMYFISQRTMFRTPGLRRLRLARPNKTRTFDSEARLLVGDSHTVASQTI